jgi:hypothetical protein
MKANYEDKIPQKTSEISLGNLYDMNKQIMVKAPEIDINVLSQKKEGLMKWVNEHFKQSYFMLLCNERKDYTVFRMRDTVATIGAVQDMVNDVIECMTNRGTLLAIDLQEAGGWELWMRDEIENEAYMYLLFPYGSAVIEY